MKADTCARHIIPFGGLRHTSRRVHPLIDYMLDATGKPRVRVCILATATGDMASHLQDWFPPERTWITHLLLFERTVPDITEFLCDQDLIFVGGGNTLSMLAVLRPMASTWRCGRPGRRESC